MNDGAIRALIFDFGGVFTHSAPIMTWLESYDGMLGLPPGTIHAALYSGETWELASTGQISMSTYWERTGASYEDRLPPPFARLKLGLFRAEPINEATVELAQALAHDFPLALCSNALGDLREVLASRPDIRELFSVIVISAEVGMRKPNTAILELTAARLDLPRQACLLVDDKPRNINAAATIGMPGIVFDSSTQLRSQLADRGIWRTS